MTFYMFFTIIILIILGLYANIQNNYHHAFDVDCKQKLSAICQNVELHIKMRGLCVTSVFDRSYHLTEFKQDGRKMFLGPSGWELGRIAEESYWSLTNPRYAGKIY